MDEQNNAAEEVRQLIENAKNIAIVPSEVAGADSFTAAVGLYHTLKSQEKDVSLVYIGKIPEEAQNIIDRVDLTDDIYSRQLTISIDYSDTPASKLAYSNEDHVLHLVLAPISKDFDRSRIKTKIQGHNFDLIFSVGVQSPSDLGLVYQELQDTFAAAEIINLDNTKMNTRHGSVNIIDNSASSLSEAVFKLFSRIGMVPSGKGAKALLVGMTYREPQS